MAVAGALLVVQVGQGEAPAGTAPLAAAPGGPGLWPVSAGVPAPVAAPLMDSQFIRDAQIDRLLEAHRGALGGAMVVPGGMKRHLDPVMPASAQVLPGQATAGGQPASAPPAPSEPLR
jgi:hypothetical protein